MHDVETESQDTTELCDVYLVGSELCGVCCVLWCVGSGFQVQGLGSGNLDPMRATIQRNNESNYKGRGKQLLVDVVNSGKEPPVGCDRPIRYIIPYRATREA